MDKDTGTRQVKRTFTDWIKVIVLLLDEVVVIALVIVVLNFLGVKIPLPVMIVGLLLVGVIVFFIHKAVIPSFHLKPASGSEALIGTHGRVIISLTPKGTVIINGERWKARAVEDHIEIDEEVEVVGLEGLTLKVRRI